MCSKQTLAAVFHSSGRERKRFFTISYRMSEVVFFLLFIYLFLNFISDTFWSTIYWGGQLLVLRGWTCLVPDRVDSLISMF
jgi:hypothetical protein